MSFSRVAVLNRGDAAMRFMRTARELARGDGPRLEVVAVFTDPDRDAPYVRLADDAVPLGPALRRQPDGTSVSAYCDHSLVVERLVAAGCDAVWPGWGFSSEDPEMVDALHAAGLVFIGPPSSAMRRLGDKVQAKRLAEQCGVPLAPWAALDLDDPTTWAPTADEVGYPIMVKAANGGGGRGIRRVTAAVDLARAVHDVVAEATAAFGPGEVFLERCIDDARHVEVQFLVNADGAATTFGVRDCSLQRRHQKVIEETPSPVLTPVEEARLTTATTRLVEAAGYRGVGTAEFLFTPSDRLASFCEVNARLQVEHTVTEMVWGVDLVRAQIDVALGRPPEISPGPRGWAIEARLAAEDPERGFAPSPGTVLVHRPPAGPNVRVDAGIRAGTSVPPEFDSMIAKVLAWGPTRERALSTLARAVGEYEVLIEDGATNRGALVDLLSRPEVRDAAASTTWLESVDDLGAEGRRAGAFIALAVAAIRLAGAERDERVRAYFAGAGTGVPVPDEDAGRPVELELSLRGEVHRVAVASRGGPRWSVRSLGPGAERVDVVVEPLDATAVVVTVGGRSSRVLVHRGNGAVVVDVEGTVHRVTEAAVGVIAAPGPALVVSIGVDVGDTVDAGARLGTLESMKTESPILSARRGVVDRVLVRPGDHVAAGQPMVVLRDDKQETAPSDRHRTTTCGPRTTSTTTPSCSTRSTPWCTATRSPRPSSSTRIANSTETTSWSTRATRCAVHCSNASGSSRGSRRSSSATCCCSTTTRERSAPSPRSTSSARASVSGRCSGPTPGRCRSNRGPSSSACSPRRSVVEPSCPTHPNSAAPSNCPTHPSCASSCGGWPRPEPTSRRASD